MCLYEALMVARTLKGWKSPEIGKIIYGNLAGAIGVHVWMLNDLSKLEELIPQKELDDKRK